MSQTNSHAQAGGTAKPIGLLIAAVGVVYGDIGTSPLYTLKEVFQGGYGVEVTHDAILGVLSLIFWSLIWVVSFKYMAFVLRADNQGEGGIMALMALARRASAKHPRLQMMMVVFGLFGAALFYGDSMITPAVSVLSAMEGLELAFDGLDHWIVPMALVVLVGLFLIQRHGTARIGVLFGPVMVVWFLVLGALGVYGIMQSPEVLKAVNPAWGLNFFIIHPGIGVAILGAVVLALTGAEALYADMGHFGRKPISRAWFILVLPALLLNYFGQGALVLGNPETVRNPFYLLAPSWALLPLIGLSTMATIIASQAVISGAFSMTLQAIQLGYIPRMHIQHTSSDAQGQIYIGAVNWALMVGVIMLVIGFESSGALASAYGVAVTGTMLCTTILVSTVMLMLWKWPPLLAVPLLICLLLVDGLFFAANVPKIFQGGAFPVLAGAVLFILMTTWKRGKQLLAERIDEGGLPLPIFIGSIRVQPPHRVQGTAVFLTARSDAVPHALLHNMLHNQVLHEQVVLLTVVYEDTPRVPSAQRFEVESYGEGFYRVILHFGFIDEPDVPAALALCHLAELDFSPMRTTYFLSRETVIPSKMDGMARWREALFAFMLKNANGNLRFFKLPFNRVIELGTQVEM
ncbi:MULTISPECIES: potassium transporter Kup [Pseudomonas syringae group]|uniref:Probable potassium transport system protein Kup n=2 Tax=Pseudomonas syringae group TaxID=136849 RepID=A0ABY1UA77_PSESX|nr:MULTISPECIES: potassium transporter Kup [Pseudomonas syringae group]KWT02679.1 potassium transporter Kup [Pseudomonas syringae pv. avii]POQ09774.1 potassium transporter Kup [Pseudomonas syringae pv. avii]SOQ12223.1 potassium transporter [Pseudomonas syringae pv. persicae]SOQ12435.1 potassium transporter [Pseudomonas syringae pv. persicae]SOS28334.1 putative potassium transport system protein kup [Pseudomonas syringae pv. avii]